MTLSSKFIQKALLFFGMTMVGFSAMADFSVPQQPAATLKFFGGAVTAQLSWMAVPSTSKVSPLKIELFDSANKVYDLDPSVLAVDLLMTDMPSMGTDQQNVVSMSDAGGNPIPGVFVAPDVKFSMRGGWTVEVTLPNPGDQKQKETQKFNLIVK
jgi:hypothetical protein